MSAHQTLTQAGSALLPPGISPPKEVSAGTTDWQGLSPGAGVGSRVTPFPAVILSPTQTGGVC